MKTPVGQLCWFMRATARRLFPRLISRVRRPSLWNMKKKVSMHVNIIARNLAQHQSLPNTFTYQISLMNHEKLAILFRFFNFFALQTPSPNKSLLNTRAWAENNGYQAWKGPCGQLCWFMRATAGRQFSRLIWRVRRPILWNMKKKVSIHVNIYNNLA